jgi:hypothetical protein
MSDESEISKVREEEAQRGRRPQHSSEKEKRRRYRKMAIDSLRRGNKGLYQQILTDLGQKPGSDEFEALMKEFDDYQRGKH